MERNECAKGRDGDAAEKQWSKGQVLWSESNHSFLIS